MDEDGNSLPDRLEDVLKVSGIVNRLLVNILGPQNSSLIETFVKGTGTNG